jgi:serine/threonine protein kinase
MAPEQLAGEPVTAASDQFGLAVTLIELVTGHRPFAGETPWTILDAIRGGTPDLSGVPVELVSSVGRALSVAPAGRFASMLELRAALPATPTDAPALAAWVLTRITM